MSAPLLPEQVSQIKALLAEHGLTVSRKRGTKAKAKPRRYKRLCGYQGPTRASLTKGHVSTAGSLRAPNAAIWAGGYLVTEGDASAYRKTHAFANQWLRMRAAEFGVTFGPHRQ